ncbi:MAG: peptidylprolyl isomerase [Flavobacteriales bacterium]|nr:peptidylprolyl isomerase [Flavobacteriales bacterium]
MKTLKTIILALCVVSLSSCGKYSKLPDGIYADIKVEKGPELLLKLDTVNTPMTTGNFVALAEGTMTEGIDPAYQGKKYYDGLVFHRVIRDFMIQTGDPKGTGEGGPGYQFPNEVSDVVKHHAGVIAMANAGADTNGSQFYITEAETPWLDGGYSIFGELVDTADVAKVKMVNQGNKIKEVVIVRKGKSAEKWDAVKAFTEGKTKIEAEHAAKAAALKATIDSTFATAEVLPSGVKILYIEKGKGKPYKAGETARVNYTGMFLDGKVFDSSLSEGRTPFEFTLGAGQVIKGWDEAVAVIPVGSKAKVYLPSDMAYGQRGVGPIPANTDLIFDIEVLKK